MNEQTNDTLQDQILKILFAEGLDEGLANIAQILMNAGMLIERENHIGVGPCQRGDERNGHANGFKLRTFPPFASCSLPSHKRATATRLSAPQC